MKTDGVCKFGDFGQIGGAASATKDATNVSSRETLSRPLKKLSRLKSMLAASAAAV